jgi:hypothetical protein
MKSTKPIGAPHLIVEALPDHPDLAKAGVAQRTCVEIEDRRRSSNIAACGL